MKFAAGQTADLAVVAEQKVVRLLWINVYNTGTASAAGSVIVEDRAGTDLFTVRVTPSDGGGATDWQRFIAFPGRGLESRNGLNINIVSATNIAFDIAYE